MDNRQKDFDICLFVVGMEYTRQTDVIITIQYGSIILRKGNILVELVGSLYGERIQQLLIPKAVNKLEEDLIKVWIPYSLINNSDLINEYLDYIFKPLGNPKGVATISLPRKIVLVLNKKKEVFLDRFFCNQKSEKYQLFHIQATRGKFLLKFIVNNSEALSQTIDIQVRDGKGNEDL